MKKNWGVLAVTGKLILAPEGRPRAGENIGGWWLEHKCHTVRLHVSCSRVVCRCTLREGGGLAVNGSAVARHEMAQGLDAK